MKIDRGHCKNLLAFMHFHEMRQVTLKLNLTETRSETCEKALKKGKGAMRKLGSANPRRSNASELVRNGPEYEVTRVMDL